MFNSYTWNDLTPVQTIAILVHKQISSNSFKIKIAFKL